MNAANPTKPKAGLWHWSPAKAGDGRLAELDQLCTSAAHAGLDYIAFKSHDGADTRYLTDAQLERAKSACDANGLGFVLWQYVYAQRPPAAEAAGFAETIQRFRPDFVFIDVEIEYEQAKGPVSREYADAFRSHLPHFPATIAPFGRADKHPGIDYKAWRDRGFSVAPQAYECDSHELTPSACADSFSKFWPRNKQWVVVGLQKGKLGRLDAAHIGASLKGLPFVNVSGWYSSDFTPDQLRGLAAHPGPVRTPQMFATSAKTLQQQLVACGFLVDVTGEMDDATREAIRFFQTGWCGLRALQADGRPTPMTRLALAYAARNHGSMGRKAKNFRFQEFRLDNRGDPRVRRLVGLAAQAYRDRFGATTILRSASTADHNKDVGGASDSRHLFPDHWDAIDVSPQNRSVADVSALGFWSGIGHHAATGLVDHLDLRGDPHSPTIFPDK